MNYEIGTRVGDYEVLAVLGAGGMGKVYKVRNVISDRVEAMKVLLPNLEDEPELADRFLREIKVQASLVHPNIAGLHTAIRVDNQLLMLMEFVEGQTLEQKLRASGIPVRDAVDYISQVLSALSYAHSRGIIHRDIKPANMMLTSGGVVKLMDFGIAKAATDRRLTMTGTTVGSLYYMSPEQIQGSLDLDARADLYSVGVSLYELVTGKRPFDGDSQFAIMSAHLEKQPVPPLNIDPTLPSDLNDVILLAVAKDPNQRFQTADAFRNALTSVLPQAGRIHPVEAPARPQEPAAAAAPGGSSPVKPKRGLYVATGAVACALAVIGVIQFGPWKQTSASQFPSPATETPALPATGPGAEPEAYPVTSPVAQPAVSPSAPAGAQSIPQASPPRTGSPLSRQVATPTEPQRREPSHGTNAAQPVTRSQSAPAGTVSEPAAASAPTSEASPPKRAAQAASETQTAELQILREHIALLSGRIAVVRGSLDNLQKRQASGGLGLRGDMAEAAVQMNTYFDGAKAALDANDAASAKRFAGLAERQLERLEKFLGR